LQWKEYSKNEGSDIPVELSPSYIASVFQQHQYKDTGLHLNQDVLAKFRPGKDKGKHVLISITSWIILSNISLDGDSSFNLVSPTLAHLWKLCRSSHTGTYHIRFVGRLYNISEKQPTDQQHTDAWNQWAWGKARVYICQNLCPGIDPTEVAQYEPYREPLNNDAHEKAIALLENLLEPFFTFADSSREELHQCLVSAAYLGLFIHKDLRPWRFSFDYSGKTKGMPETDPSRWRDQTPDKNYVQKRLIEIGAGGKPVFRSHVLPPLSPEAQDPFFKLGKEFNVPSGKM
jgi:hypothetical protein